MHAYHLLDNNLNLITIASLMPESNLIAGRLTLGCGAQRRLQRLKPLQLHAQAGVDRQLAGAAGDAPRVVELGVQSGGAGDGEVGALTEGAAVASQGRRDERQAQGLGLKQSNRLSVCNF
jgi:hypothetical protein